MSVERLRNRLVQLEVVSYGTHKYTRGGSGGYYADLKVASTDPIVLKEVKIELSELVRGCTAMAGPVVGAVPYMAVVCENLNIPFIMIRREERRHGRPGKVIGIVPSDGEIAVFDDVANTGGSLIDTIRGIRNLGGLVRNAYCIVDREEGAVEKLRNEGVILTSLIRASEIVDRGRIST